ncbi:MAG: hypothetical protein ACJATF_000355 [Flavobacteriales bacterium]|jgi:hypothetical protein
MIIRITTLLLFSFLFSISAQAQKLDTISNNRDLYVKQLETFMTSSKRQVMEKLFSQYKKYLKSGVFTDEEFEQIVSTSNLMLRQKMRASPHFSNYLSALMVVKSTEEDQGRFVKWHNVLDGMLTNIEDRKVKPYDDFLKFSIDFFAGNTLRTSKGGVTWYTIADKYELFLDGRKPKLKYEQLDLFAHRKNDTITIKKTSGIYSPIDLEWKGVGGTVVWERYGLEEEIYVELDTYALDVKKSLYRANNVKLSYPDFFPNTKILGRFEDKILTGNKATGGSYPRFESYKEILTIEDLGANTAYKGGFRLHGTTVYGFGSKENKAIIAIKDKNNEVSFRGESLLFVIRKGEKLSGEKVEAVMYMDGDSLFHPSVNVRFNIPNKELSLYRGKRGSDRNPFFSSFHQMNLDVDNIDWLMGRDSVLLGKTSVSFSKANKKVEFESLNYFEENDFRRIQNLSTTNPISIIKSFAEEEGTDMLSANRLAKRLNTNYDVTSIQSLLYDLVAQGFVNYDSEDQIVEVKQKVYHYVAAYAKQVDFDLLRITSQTDSTNAVMLVSDKSIETNAVSSVEYSQTQKVGARPFKEKLIMKKNRDMDFDGRVFAGFGQFEGKDFSFIYDKNQIIMDSIRFFDLFIPDLEKVDKEGNPSPEAYSIASRIEHTMGVLLIDAPLNMSGTEEIPMFPSLNTKGPAYIYYDYKETQKAAYPRDSFYFQLDKFTFNSLDNFTEEDLKFDGEMITADIFPPFKETLLLREEDASLGFVNETPLEGYPCYLNKGTYKGSVDLSNIGLLGKGNITYLSASLNSEDIIFKPKQLTATAELFALEEDRTSDLRVPHTRGYDVSIDWRPYQDSMYVRTKEKDFKLFNKNVHTLSGLLILTPGGLKGRGLFDWDQGSLDSELMSFGPYSVLSDTANLKIKTGDLDALAFDTKDINANLDFDREIGYIQSNKEDNLVTMPYNQYQTTLNDFVWDMKEQTVTFKNEDGADGVFTSIHPNQDSLRFTGKTAFYDLKSNQLSIGDVPYIQSSDAYIYTSDGAVGIESGGRMGTLQNAKIVADTITKYHVINRATVDILGKKEYRATGFYEYNIGSKIQEIEFANIIGTRVGKGKRSEKKSVTRAKGEVQESDDFFIDQKTGYKGQISLSADSKNLQFKGFARLDSPKLPSPEWFSVAFEGDKNDLAIVYDIPKNEDGARLKTGLYVSRETAEIYPRIMMPLRYSKDRPIIEAKGLFKYDKIQEEFNFGDSMKIADDVPFGNKLNFSNKTGKYKVEGKLNVGTGLDYVKVKAAGAVTGDFGGDAPPKDLIFKMMAGMEIILPNKLLKIMAADLKSNSFESRVIDYVKSADFYEKALAEFIPPNKEGNVSKDYKEARNRMLNTGLNLPNKYDKYSFLFSDLPMKWNSEYQSFVSMQDELGLCSINGEIYNRYVKSFVEFKMPSNNDDRMYIYILSPAEQWYYFGYKQGILSVVSSNEKFMEELNGLKKKEMIKKMDDGETYEIQVANPSTATMFVTRAQAARK